MLTPPLQSGRDPLLRVYNHHLAYPGPCFQLELPLEQCQEGLEQPGGLNHYHKVITGGDLQEGRQLLQEVGGGEEKPHMKARRKEGGYLEDYFFLLALFQKVWEICFWS